MEPDSTMEHRNNTMLPEMNMVLRDLITVGESCSVSSDQMETDSPQDLLVSYTPSEKFKLTCN